MNVYTINSTFGTMEDNMFLGIDNDVTIVVNDSPEEYEV